MNKIINSKFPQVIFAQLGARQHYAEPSVLSQAGMLGHFFTDTYSGNGSSWKSIAKISQLFPQSIQPTLLKSLLGRKQDIIPGKKVTAFNTFGLHYKLKLLRAKNDKERRETNLWAASKFANKILKSLAKYNISNMIYGFNGCCQELIPFAKTNNIKIIIDQIDASLYDERLVEQESNLWPSWEDEPAHAIEDEMFDREKFEWENADLIIVRSDFTKNALISMGADYNKIRVIPLAIDINKFRPSVRDKQKSNIKFLFLGSISLRKGIQYALEAFKKIKSSHVSFIVVGGRSINFKIDILKKNKDICHYIGPVPRKDIASIYNSADVFLFPTISDGFGLTQLEAMACGLPVISTPNCGSVVRDGIDGFIIPIRNSEVLAEKIELLASNPELISFLGQNAQKRAAEFCWENYKNRLIQTIDSIMPIS